MAVTSSVSIYTVLLSCLLLVPRVSSVPAPAWQSSSTKSTSTSTTLTSQTGLQVVETSRTSSGDILDWIPFDSQGDVADPPPFAPSKDGTAHPGLQLVNPNQASTDAKEVPLEKASSTLNQTTAKRALDRRAKTADNGTQYSTYSSSGKKLGIVPVPRFPSYFKPVKRAPANITEIQSQQKTWKPPTSKTTKPSKFIARALAFLKRQSTNYAGSHWYVTSNYGTVTKGAKAIFSCFKPYVNPADFSLLQLAVGRTGLASGLQTVEAGYQYYPGFKNTPRIFTFFNTNGYASQGDYVGGYDQTVKGWVQSSSNYYPGIAVSNYSAFGGTQVELNLQYMLYNGNWWLWIQSEWAGYYPGSLFSANQADATQTLATSGDQTFFYGEIAQGGSSLTNTDMGSGKSATTGYRQSAYIRNMQYYTPSNTFTAYPVSSVDFYDSDSSRYNHSYTTAGATNWGSYVYLGGYGAGGVTGA